MFYNPSDLLISNSAKSPTDTSRTGGEGEGRGKGGEVILAMPEKNIVFSGTLLARTLPLSVRTRIKR